MNKVKLLEAKKLLKELDYIESDFEYRKEIISEADAQFMDSINQFLQNHPELKELYDNKITEKINQSIKKEQENSEGQEEPQETDQFFDENGENIQNEELENSEEDEQKIEDSKHLSQLKKLYREIVKLTHPDKIKNDRLNELYLKATVYYEQINKIGIYAVCNELSIPYEIEEDDINLIYDQIQRLQGKINFIESTYTWKWYNCESDEQKDQIVMDFIKLRIR